ncbi:ABC transporter permease [Streptacidiphilus rugosus]|uniref:ABC transporter permease n=1 Tax=Streptacidiphilus rugosus TaxID=405783 RepID=UPI000560CFD8
MRAYFDRLDWERIGLAIAAPVLAILFAALVTTIVLLISGQSPTLALSDIFSYDIHPDSTVAILNRATTYFLAGLAVALGFRMNIFNIGVEGQYKIGVFFAAYVAGIVGAPGPIKIILAIVAGVVAGALYAGIVAVLKVTRGVNEVIASIMLNYIAINLIAYLLQPNTLGFQAPGSNNVSTKPLPASAMFFTISTYGGNIWGFVIIAALLGVGFHLLLARTRFGFDLRTAGQSDGAAQASGVNTKKMILIALLLSGGLAGLTGVPELLQDAGSYNLTFPSGVGFTGIAIALLGRNNPIGIALGALMWGAFDRASNQLGFDGFQPEIVLIIEGTIVISVVVAYEVVRRYGLKRQQSRVGRELAAAAAQAAGSTNKEAAA